MQREPCVAHPPDAGHLPAHGQAEGQRSQDFQHGLGKGLGQGDHPRVPALGRAARFLLGLAQRPQHLQHPGFRRAEVHPLRPIRKALAEFHRFAPVHRLNHLGNGAHHIQPLFPHPQPQADSRPGPSPGLIHKQGDFHPQRAVLGQGGLHGLHQPRPSRGRPAAEHLVQHARLSGGQQGGRHMAARALFLIGIAGAGRGLFHADEDIPPDFIRHGIAHIIRALLRQAHAAALGQVLPGPIFLLARQLPEAVWAPNHGVRHSDFHGFRMLRQNSILHNFGASPRNPCRKKFLFSFFSFPA